MEATTNSRDATVYLDIDGVIFPRFELLSPEGYRDTKNGSLSKEWLNGLEFYHPEVIEALGAATVGSLVTLSSSRMVGFLDDPMYQPIVEQLHIEGALFIDIARPGSIEAKQDAVRRHWSGVGDAGLEAIQLSRGRGNAYTREAKTIAAEGDRALWADDHIFSTDLVRDQERYTKRLRKLSDLAGVRLFAPNPATGLTLDDVARIHDFLRIDRHTI